MDATTSPLSAVHIVFSTMGVDYVSTLDVPNARRVRPNFASLMEVGGAVRFLDAIRALETSFFAPRKCFGDLSVCCISNSCLLFVTLSDALSNICVFLFTAYEKSRWWEAMHL
jgi:hypothetical protein